MEAQLASLEPSASDCAGSSTTDSTIEIVQVKVGDLKNQSRRSNVSFCSFRDSDATESKTASVEL